MSQSRRHRVPWIAAIASVMTFALLSALEGRGEDAVPNKRCQENRCSEMPNASSGDCEAGILCKFSSSSGEIVWCADHQGSSCKVIEPNVQQECNGSCVGYPDRGCTSKYNKRQP